jgi:hypothetical protein
MVAVIAKRAELEGADRAALASHLNAIPAVG